MKYCKKKIYLKYLYNTFQHENCAHHGSKAGPESPAERRSVLSPCCPHPAERRLLPGDTPRAGALRARAAGTGWVPAPRGTSETCQEVAEAPHIEYCGCSSPEGGAEVCVTSRPGAAETKTVERLGGTGGA